MTQSPAEAPRSLVAHGPFAAYFFGRLFSSVAGRISAVAVGWQIYALTGSALALGLVGLAQYLPAMSLTLIAGHAVDRFDRKRITQWSRLAKGAAALALTLASLLGALSPAWLYGAVAMIGAATAFESPAVAAMLTAVVPPSQVPRASAFSTASLQLAEICGPPLGGLAFLIAPSAAFALIAMSWLISVAATHRIDIPAAPPAPPGADIRSLFAGLAFVRSDKAILGTISLDLFAVLFGGATALLPIYAKDILHGGPWALGLLRGAPAVGALAMTVALARAPMRGGVGKKMFAAVFVFGAATILFAISTNMILSLAALAVMGASDTVSVVIRSLLVQLRTPDAMRGRVGAVNYLFVNTSNQLGEFESGATAALWGAMPAVVIGGIGTIVVALVWMRLFPTLRDVDTLA